MLKVCENKVLRKIFGPNAEATQSATLYMLCTLCSLHQVATLAAIRTRHVTNATHNYFVLPAARDCMALLRMSVLSYVLKYSHKSYTPAM